MSKQSLPNLSRSTATRKASPFDIVIVGGQSIKEATQRSDVDTADGEEHFLYRRGFDRPVPPERLESIKTDGIRVPPTIAAIDGKPVCIMGATRIRAARQLWREAEARGETPEPITVLLTSVDPEQLERDIAVENYQRKVMSPGDLLLDVRAKAAKGWAPEQIATALGLRTAHYAKQLIRFDQNVPPKVREALVAGRITLTAAMALERVPEDKVEEALQETEEAPKGRGGAGGAKAAKAAAARVTGEALILPPGKKVLKKALASLRSDAETARGDEATRLSLAADVISWALTGNGPTWLQEYTGVVEVKEEA